MPSFDIPVIRQLLALLATVPYYQNSVVDCLKAIGCQLVINQEGQLCAAPIGFVIAGPKPDYEPEETSTSLANKQLVAQLKTLTENHDGNKSDNGATLRTILDEIKKNSYYFVHNKEHHQQPIPPSVIETVVSKN